MYAGLRLAASDRYLEVIACSAMRIKLKYFEEPQDYKCFARAFVWTMENVRYSRHIRTER
jgi:hypothetical protein